MQRLALQLQPPQRRVIRPSWTWAGPLGISLMQRLTAWPAVSVQPKNSLPAYERSLVTDWPASTCHRV